MVIMDINFALSDRVLSASLTQKQEILINWWILWEHQLNDSLLKIKHFHVLVYILNLKVEHSVVGKMFCGFALLTNTRTCLYILKTWFFLFWASNIGVVFGIRTFYQTNLVFEKMYSFQSFFTWLSRNWMSFKFMVTKALYWKTQFWREYFCLALKLIFSSIAKVKLWHKKSWYWYLLHLNLCTFLVNSS